MTKHMYNVCNTHYVLQWLSTMNTTLQLSSRLLTGAGLWTEGVQRRGSSGHRGPPRHTAQGKEETYLMLLWSKRYSKTGDVSNIYDISKLRICWSGWSFKVQIVTCYRMEQQMYQYIRVYLLGSFWKVDINSVVKTNYAIYSFMNCQWLYYAFYY